MQQGIYPVALSPLDLFNFVPDRQEARHALAYTGRLPWFSSPNLHLAAFRPLASALVYVDYAWLEAHHHPVRAHLHSIAWWVVLLVGIAVLFIDVLPPAAAGFAILFSSVDEAYVWPVSWIANRSQIVAITFVVWGLCALARAERRRFMRVLALGLVALGFACGEHALAPFAYVVAYELFGGASRGGRSEAPTRLLGRSARLVPWAALVLVFGAIRHVLGYGIAGSSFYIDPLAEPLRYVQASTQRLPQLLAELWFGVAAEWREHWPRDQFPLVARVGIARGWLEPHTLTRCHDVLGLLGAFASFAIVAHLSVRGRRGDAEARAAHWIFLGALGALVPLCGTEPMSRLTVAPGIGFSALFGWIAWKSWQLLERRMLDLRSVLAALALCSLLYVHTAQAAIRSASEALAFSRAWPDEQAKLREAEFDRQELAGRHLVIITSGAFAVQFSLLYMLHFDRATLPVSSELLSPAFSNEHVLSRPGPNVLDIHYPQPLLGNPFQRSVYRTDSARFELGERIHAPRFDVLVLGVENGQPTRLRFIFDRDLDDPRHIFLFPREGVLRRVDVPSVGDSLHLLPDR